jgi:hypothetical protein
MPTKKTAKKTKSRKTKRRGENPDTSPRYTLIIIGDDGKYYKLQRQDWAQDQYVVGQEGDPSGGPSIGVIDQLKEYGTYLAYLPPEQAVGIGHICTVVNLESIIKNQD